jgi:hypothetical protein
MSLTAALIASPGSYRFRAIIAEDIDPSGFFTSGIIE